MSPRRSKRLRLAVFGFGAAAALLLCGPGTPRAAMGAPATAPRQDAMKSNDDLAWPPITPESRPWTRWWWMGSAVSEPDIDRQLKLFRDAGIGGVEISDLWLPFFCVSSNLTSGAYQLHRTGELQTALRASISLPGVMPPATENGAVLVDGAVMKNFPADLMRLSHLGPIVGVDVSRGRSIPAYFALLRSRERSSRWRISACVKSDSLRKWRPLRLKLTTRCPGAPEELQAHARSGRTCNAARRAHARARCR